ncbi:hypothetical protein [Vibrio sp. Hal054]|uniref:hypothetical protein n=1 Tax=Vibrio sp. Hal054 TaxID=3035158 RepID=UPI00301BD2A8
MKFKNSLSTSGIESAPLLDSLVINSSAKISQENVLSFDQCVDALKAYHDPSLDKAILAAVSNSDQPIFNFKDVEHSIPQDPDSLFQEQAIDGPDMGMPL